MWDVVFPRKLFNELQTFLFSASPNENGCFLLANHYKVKDKSNVFLITKVILPSADSWSFNGEDSLVPKSSYINDAVVAADFEKSSLIFIHTHPSPFHPVTFSSIDESSNKRLFANLSQILPDTPLGSLVISTRGVYGVVFDKKKLHLISTVRISGDIISEIPVAKSANSKNIKIDPMYDRQVKMFGEKIQKKLQDLTITIVGVGGTGSSVAVQLARMGIKKLRLIDFDILDETNVSRVYGATIKDVGRPKVDVLKNHLNSFSKTSVEILQADITKIDVLRELVDSDVIFSCTDNLMSRSVLNDLSLQYYIPLIDVGCRIHLDKDRTIDQAIVKVQKVTPDSACLWCTGTLDGKIILQESFSDEEKENLAAEGYHEGIEKQPSIISLTTLAASLSVNKLLSIVGIFGNNFESPSIIELKNSFANFETPKIKSDCVCQKRRGIADKRKIF